MSEASAALLKVRTAWLPSPAGDRVLCLTVLVPGWWLVLTTASCHLTWEVKRWVRSWLCHCPPSVCRASPSPVSKAGVGPSGLRCSQELGQIYPSSPRPGIWLPCSGVLAHSQKGSHMAEEQRGHTSSPTLGGLGWRGQVRPLQEGQVNPYRPLSLTPPSVSWGCLTAMWDGWEGGQGCPDPEGWRASSAAPGGWIRSESPAGSPPWRLCSCTQDGSRSCPQAPGSETFRTLFPSSQPLPASPAALLYYGDKEAEGQLSATPRS